MTKTETTWTRNLFVLKKEKYMIVKNSYTNLSNTFVDIWGQADWYSKDYVNALEEKINGILSR